MINEITNNIIPQMAQDGFSILPLLIGVGIIVIVAAVAIVIICSKGKKKDKIKHMNLFGGFDFTGAKEDKTAQIENLRVDGKRMAYSWKSGSTMLRNWGLADSDPKAIAVFGVSNDRKKYNCGKFEWISATRLTRDLDNINNGYEGWPRNSIGANKYFCFCIVSNDGSKRTNWIYTD